MIRDASIRAMALRNHARAMQRLLQTISHEIRSPLNVIIGSMQLMALDDNIQSSLMRGMGKETFLSATQAALMLNLVVNNVLAQYKVIDGE